MVRRPSFEDSPYKPRVMVTERPIDSPRALKVIYIGAGVSGIIAAIRFRQAVPGLDLVIYEKNPSVGGTWYENRYVCDRNNLILRIWWIFVPVRPYVD